MQNAPHKASVRNYLMKQKCEEIEVGNIDFAL